MRKLPAIVLGLVVASSAQAATVTYTLSRREAPSGVTNSTNFTVWATVEPGAESFGLYAYNVDLGTAPGAPTVNFAVTQRAPGGFWDVDETDPNFDPAAQYPSRSGAFTILRATSPTGAVSGAMDPAAFDPDPTQNNLVVVKGLGQTAGNMANLPRPTYLNLNGTTVQSKPYVPISLSDVAYGVPRNNAFSSKLPAGSLRLFTGSISSGNISDLVIEPTTDTRAKVFKNNDPTNIDTEANNQVIINYRSWALILPPPDTLGIFASTSFTNQAAGGAIHVSGSNNRYVSEVNSLLDPPVNEGFAPVQTIGDETGTLWVMARINGPAAEVLGVQTEFDNGSRADPATAAALHASYDALFGDGGFNLLYTQSNYVGAKNIVWSFTIYPNVTIDQMAVVPEPAAFALLLAAAIIVLRRRRRRIGRIS